MLRKGALAQYATCERARHRVALATWELEENLCWGNFLAQSLEHLRLEHQYSETDLEIWEQACTNRGLQDLQDDKVFFEYTATQESLTLAVLQEQACQLKEYVERRGIDNDTDREDEDEDEEEEASPSPDGGCRGAPTMCYGSPTFSQSLNAPITLEC